MWLLFLLLASGFINAAGTFNNSIYNAYVQQAHSVNSTTDGATYNTYRTITAYTVTSANNSNQTTRLRHLQAITPIPTPTKEGAGGGGGGGGSGTYTNASVPNASSYSNFTFIGNVSEYLSLTERLKRELNTTSGLDQLSSAKRSIINAILEYRQYAQSTTQHGYATIPNGVFPLILFGTGAWFTARKKTKEKENDILTYENTISLIFVFLSMVTIGFILGA